jgi:hypothetical protein
MNLCRQFGKKEEPDGPALKGTYERQEAQLFVGRWRCDLDQLGFAIVRGPLALEG